MKFDDKTTNPVTGRLLRLTADSLYFTPNGLDTLGYAAGSVSRLDVSLGEGSAAYHGAAIGALAGAGAGLIAGLLASSEDCSGLGCVNVGVGDVVGVMGILGALGAGAGALIGAASRRERWTQVPRPWVWTQTKGGR